MKVGLIGFAEAGKSTLYRACAGPSGKGDVTSVPVPDERFNFIVNQVKPKKATPATIILHDDLDDIQGTGKKFTQRFLDAARRVDVLLHVVRGFDSAISPFYAEINPVRDHVAIEEELVLTDLQVVENRLEKLTKSQTAKQPGSNDYLEKALFEKIRPDLENGIPLRDMVLAEDEAQIVRNFQFLSLKQLVTCFNLDESAAGNPPEPVLKCIESISQRGSAAFALCATIEAEIAQLEPSDQREFLDSMNIEEPAAAVMIRALYKALGLITFFTAGENETRAWMLRSGSNALAAAGTIHTDIAKGFIRAEVVHYEDYLSAGSLDAAYSAGKMHLEGKEAIIKDGDLLHIRNKS